MTRPLEELTVLEELADLPEPLGRLPSGRAVMASVRAGAEGDERIHVISPSGRIELSIRFDAQGPVLELDAVSLSLKAGRIAMECDELETTVNGNMREVVRGRRTAHSLGRTSITGRDVDLTADAGELRVASEKDLSIQGENVLINC